MPNAYRTLFERIVANCAEAPDQLEGTGCWLWKGQRGPGGYGLLHERKPPGGRGAKIWKRRAHRRMAEAILGRPLTEEETIEHACYWPWCENPDHFKICSNADNVRLARMRRAGAGQEAMDGIGTWLADMPVSENCDDELARFDRVYEPHEPPPF